MKSALYAGTALTAAALMAAPAFAQSRDQIRIVGSSTVFPYTQAVAEQFAGMTGMAAPVVESTGTGGGMQIFCGGVGTEHPDITGASRAMTNSEYELCAQNGVDNITEVLIGYDGLSVAGSIDGPDFALTEAQLFQALAAEVEVDGALVPNPYTNWQQIDPSLPDDPIQVFGPPPTSGTRDAFIELVMVPGCETFAAIAALEEDRMEEVCARMRQDGPFIEAGENDNIIVQRLQADSSALGIFGYSFLYENTDTREGGHDQRRLAHVRDDRRRQLPRFPTAVLLYQERASRRDPGPRGVRHRVRLRGVVRRGRLPQRAWPDPASRRGSRDHPPGGGRRALTSTASTDPSI